MSSMAYEGTTVASTLSQLPIRIDQRAAVGSTVSRLLLISPALVAGVAAFAALSFAIQDFRSLAALAVERPVASAQILVAILLWVVLFVAPASAMIARLFQRRVAMIGAGRVEITDRSLFGLRRHSVPLSDYLGIAHHIRASLSGLTHELVLVHREPALTINLTAGARVTQADLECAKALLGLPEVPARTIYARKSAGLRSISVPLPPASSPVSA